MIAASDLIDRSDFYEPLQKKAETLPERKYHRIGDVAKFIGVETHVLRYWETQFAQVRPKKSSSGHRLYRTQDVYYLLLIHALLHLHRFTIIGAKRVLKDGRLFSRLNGEEIQTSGKPSVMVEQQSMTSEVGNKDTLKQAPLFAAPKQEAPVISRNDSQPEQRRAPVGTSFWRDIEALQKETEKILDDVREVSIRLREKNGPRIS